jgi:septal ring-binding cell division protein DamX
MESFRKNLHLTRQEAGMVFILVVLLSGLMFSVGLWVGMGFSNGNPAVAQQAVEHGEHARSPASVEHAQHAAPKVERAGEELRKAFHDSKQKALTEVMVETADTDTPKSILDNKAHAEAFTDWSRKPASVQVDEEESKAFNKIQAEEEARKKAGPPTKVSGLFERSPDAVKDFEPAPGTYTLQLASYATLDESVAMVKTLRKSGFLDAYTHEIKFKNGETWHRVAMGSYPNPVYARKMGERLRKRALAKDFIVRKVAD